MASDRYLTTLENEDSIAESLPRYQPELSSYYWARFGEKHTVYIPTKTKLLYLNIEQYDAADIEHVDVENQWRKAKKCANISISPESEEDKKIIIELNNLKKLVSRTRNQPMDEENWKYYVIRMYNVKDIKNIELELRYKMAFFSNNISIKRSEQQLSDAFDAVFEEIEKRFVEDSDHEVYHYGRGSSY